ncbi:MAG TPA: SGNH/GDSL hydrolase family protein [Candidatus Limnocylindrales bacterium]|nr:SGNH/GDSL hydrolase family protein [Candidatus Limnocylindrales bacterium]
MYRQKRLCGLSALALVVTGSVVIGDGGAATARSAAPESLAALEKQVIAELASDGWRGRLGPALAQAAAARPELSLSGSARGVVLGGKVRLPANLTLDGETTIVAQQIVLSSSTLKVTGDYPLRLYPAASLSVTGRTTNEVITIDRTGATGERGDSGAPGDGGTGGQPGTPGRDAILFGEILCEPATRGGNGTDGGNANNGREGTAGDDGANGGDIVLDIPDGSTDVYRLISHGGQGGTGGDGGPGGDGGSGGYGGNGGNGGGFAYPAYCRGGANGGHGANGRMAGSGGHGGSGGYGGEGGEIAVTYPVGYNPASIETSVKGGKGGAGGGRGGAGTGGRGGYGGTGGTSIDNPGFDGTDGIDGPDGIPGLPGSAGGDGEDGAVEIIQRFPDDDICAGMQSQQEDYTDLRQHYNSLLGNDPFPGESPPASALPVCPPPPPARVRLKGARDVAFGDSFISGEGASPFNTDPAVSPTAAYNPDCHVSLDSWVALAHRPGRTLPGGQASFQNWACSGATIDDTEDQIDEAIAAAQANGGSGVGLGLNTKAVQISVGVNDIRSNLVLVGFGEILGCALAYGATEEKDAPPSGCIPDTDPNFEANGLFNDLRPRLMNLYERIAQAAPRAIIEVVSYPMIFPDLAHAQDCTTGLVRADEYAANKIAFRLGLDLKWRVDELRARGFKIRYIPFVWTLTRNNICPTSTSPARTRNTHGVNSPTNNQCGITEVVCWFHPNSEGHRALRSAYTRASTVRFRDTASATPPTVNNGTLVSEESSNTVYVAAGGTLFAFNNPADITTTGYAYQPGVTPRRLDPSQVAALARPPANGTLLRDAASGLTYVINCGKKTPTSATPSAVSVPTHTIDDIPNGTCPPPPPTPACNPAGQAWFATTVFPAHWSCTTPKGTLVMQGDGNLVIYSQTGVPLWSTNTAGFPGARAEFRGAGELVVLATSGTELWSSRTAGMAIHGTLVFQDDGNFVIYSSTGPVWSTGTFGDPS